MTARIPASVRPRRRPRHRIATGICWSAAKKGDAQTDQRPRADDARLAAPRCKLPSQSTAAQSSRRAQSGIERAVQCQDPAPAHADYDRVIACGSEDQVAKRALPPGMRVRALLHGERQAQDGAARRRKYERRMAEVRPHQRAANARDSCPKPMSALRESVPFVEGQAHVCGKRQEHERHEEQDAGSR